MLSGINTRCPSSDKGNNRLLSLEDDRPQYAILSHTWGGEEVTLQEWQSHSRPSNRAGYDKIIAACHWATNGLRYLWCGTNCINKTSSAELSEAINSMFHWYQEANVCYGNLADVNDRASGWNMQQLLAPKAMRSGWTLLGNRKDLTQELLKGTDIPAEFLAGRSVHGASVAQRMSWLARHKTTQVEDMAYCMLGIFDINMPPLYREGRNHSSGCRMARSDQPARAV
ncbi:heterokaryon incompatibility protein-domain-containing protein [Ilyonectria sp. MPI-CAGE-AT-0026]|nr:heterokaryon incompatibility protein-domain-containing protein [Ilyonectria sp. MPI-CAGE-AT-0026]